MASQVVFVPNVVGYARAFESPAGMVGQHVRKIALETTVVGRVTSPIKTGRMAHSHVPTTAGTLEWKVTAMTGYSLFVHEGTRPHVITPKKTGGKLVFFWPKVGKVVRLAKVNHPGTSAQPWLLNALKRAMRRNTSGTIGGH